MWLPWLIDVAGDIALGFFLATALMGPAKPAMPASEQPTHIAMSGSPTVSDTSGGQVKIVAKITAGNRCMVPHVYVGERGPFTMMADSGAPDPWFTEADLPKLGIKKSSLDFHEMKGEGPVAWVTLPEVRIGNFVARNIDAAITKRHDPDFPLLGMSVLKQGHVEVAGDTCTLTFPRNATQLAARIKPGRPQ